MLHYVRIINGGVSRAILVQPVEAAVKFALESLGVKGLDPREQQQLESIKSIKFIVQLLHR